jgi:MFS family permease
LHWPGRRLLTTGSGVLAVGVLALVSVGRGWVSPYAVLGYWVIAGLGMGLAYSATSVLSLALAPEREQGRASSALQLCDGVGGVLGLAIAGAVFATAHHAGSNDGPILGWIWLGLAVVGASAMISGARSRLRA